MCPTNQDGDKKPPKESGSSADISNCQLCGQPLTPAKAEEYQKLNRRWSDKKDV